MRTATTKLGTAYIGGTEELFARAVALAEDLWTGHQGFTWALAGGSTPQAFYSWVVARRALVPDLVEAVDWYCGDERHVPLSDPQSNFGAAERLLLGPLGVAPARRHPWPVGLPAADAARRFAAAEAAGRLGPGRTFDLCFLGMGDDAHTLSLFPGSPLLAYDGGELFASVEVPGRGTRLTLTPSGLELCGRIVVMALGASKAEALRRALYGPDDPRSTPVQLLARMRERVVWLLDEAAAAAV